MLSIGIDIGGTFTDILIHDAATGGTHAFKVPSTPSDPAQALIDGVNRYCSDLKAARYLVHGTTVATNAMLQRSWDRIGLITTKGHRDRVELQRTDAYKLYDLKYHKPQALVPRTLRLEVRERVLGDGTVLEPLDAAEVLAAGRRLVEQGVNTIAVCFLNSYLNDTHERIAAQALRQSFPELTVVASHEILSEAPEYERFSTTLLNCTVASVMSGYIGRVDQELRGKGFGGTFLVTQGNGGSMTSERACLLPIGTFQSGPAAGVIAAQHVGKRKGLNNLITFDMGGTSTDVCIIQNGEPTITHEYLIDGWPMRLPVVDIHSVGAGGGSLAWLDDGGGLHVGPRSAGARPGPAAYGHGGDQPTVTDAQVILGRLSARRRLGGTIAVDRKAAETVMSRIAGQLGMTPHALASGVLRIADAHMANAIRTVSVDRGIDPRGFTLVAFGGAGPLHVGRVARELQIEQVLIPPGPGTHCALGCLVADLRHDFVRTLATDLAGVTSAQWESAFEELETVATDLLLSEGIARSEIVLNRLVDARYRGQGHVSVRLSLGQKAGVDGLANAFHSTHQDLYKHSNPDGDVEIVSVRIAAIGRRSKPPMKKVIASHRSVQQWTESVYFEELADFVECSVYERDSLPAGFCVAGPALITQMDSTTVVLPKQRATVDEDLNLILSEVH